MRVSANLVLVAACSLAICNGEVTSVGKINSGLKLSKSNGKIVKSAAKLVNSRAAEVECVAAVSTPVASVQSTSANLQTLKLVGLFVLWYGFNAGYNVYNAYVKKDFAYPFAIATLQLAIGLLYAVPLWVFGIRKMPNLNKNDYLRLLPIAFLNAAGHAAAVNAMFEKGGGSFTHVIKASEPVVSVILGLIVNGIVPKPFTAVSLLPITYGVAYASTLGQLNVATMSKELTTKAAK
jgi:solute carrier family 35 protein E1